MRESEIYLLWWQYSDGSAVGFIRSYDDETEAKRDFEMLKEVTDGYKDIRLTPVTMLEDC